MRAIMFGAIGLALIAGPAFAAGTTTCSAAIADAGNQWRAIDVAAPQKPMQAQIVGRSGQTISGADYRYITNELRLAAADCQAGNETAALQRIDGVKAVMTAGHMTGVVAEGDK